MSTNMGFGRTNHTVPGRLLPDEDFRPPVETRSAFDGWALIGESDVSFCDDVFQRLDRCDVFVGERLIDRFPQRPEPASRAKASKASKNCFETPSRIPEGLARRGQDEGGDIEPVEAMMAQGD